MENVDQSHRPLILVADDDEDTLAFVEASLRLDGFDVIRASNGKECVELAVNDRPDVILLDILMPMLDGNQVLQTLAHSEATRDIPIILISGMGGIEHRIRGLRAGATDYITKPVDPNELSARVAAAARTRARLAELLNDPGRDAVTGLQGRSIFEARLNEEVARAKRKAGRLSIMLVDIDDLDSINARYGRARVDGLLHEIAVSLRSTLRSSDSLFRFDGDEFAALLPDSDLGTAFFAAERCRAAISVTGSLDASIDSSIGIAEFAAGGQSAAQLLATAAAALGKAKESGGGRTWRADDPRRSLSTGSLAEELTPREWHVLTHLSSRRSELEIATLMGIGPGTVRSHKARIRRKLQIPHNVRIADYARAHFGSLAERSEEQGVGVVTPA